MAPHGVFRCLGDDRWVAIAIENVTQWQALCAAMARPDLAADQRYAALAGRTCHEDAIEREIEQWTASLPAERVQDDLIARGVPAHIVANAADVYRDAHLAHRGHFVSLNQRDLGEIVVGNSPATLSRTPARMSRPGPTYGQDAFYVLSEILRLSPEEIAGLAENGALE
jgi:benzylsuccinate CoA-transferase BbsF subunit